jgi:hypothetical protein
MLDKLQLTKCFGFILIAVYFYYDIPTVSIMEIILNSFHVLAVAIGCKIAVHNFERSIPNKEDRNKQYNGIFMLIKLANILPSELFFVMGEDAIFIPVFYSSKHVIITVICCCIFAFLHINYKTVQICFIMSVHIYSPLAGKPVVLISVSYRN